MQKFIFTVLFVSGCGIAAADLMRKQNKEAKDAKTNAKAKGIDQIIPAIEDVFTAGISASGILSTFRDNEKQQDKEDAKQTEEQARMAAHQTSLAQLRQNYMDIDRIVTELEKEDVVRDGYIISRVKDEDRIAWLKQEKVKRIRASKEEQKHLADPGSLLDLNEHERAQVQSSTHMRTIAAQYWKPEDHPHEVRLDPSNMKVYSFNTFKLRYPGEHRYNLESKWTKLPKAPHKVKHSRYATGGAAAGVSLLEQASQMVDENDHLLIYAQDVHGYWHQAHETLTDDELKQESNPMAYSQLEALRKDAAKREEEEKYPIYYNYTDTIRDFIEGYKTGSAAKQENVRSSMTSLRNSMESELKIKKNRHKGRVSVDIRAMDGYKCAFKVLIEQVTVKSLKQHISSKMGLPFKAQKLYYGSTELKDNDLLNKYMMSGGDRTVDLVELHKSAYDGSDVPKIHEVDEEDADSKKQASQTVTVLQQQEAKKVKEEFAGASLLETGGTVLNLDPLAATTTTTPLVPHPKILRRMLYVREEDGSVHVDKEEIATESHKIDDSNDHWETVDRGIPITALLEEEAHMQETA